MLTCRRMTLDPHLSPLIKLDQVKQRHDLEALKAIKENPGRYRFRKELSGQKSFYKRIKANN